MNLLSFFTTSTSMGEELHRMNLLGDLVLDEIRGRTYSIFQKSIPEACLPTSMDARTSKV